MYIVDVFKNPKSSYQEENERKENRSPFSILSWFWWKYT